MSQMSGRQELIAERTSTATENVDVSYDFTKAKSVIFLLRVSAIANASGDKFNLSIEQVFELPATDTPVAASETYDDFITFIEILGNASAPVEQRATWHRDTTVTTDFQVLSQALGDDVLHGPISGKIRANAVVTSADDPSFTWSLYAWVLEDID
jgi:predicted phage tail protein